MTLIRLANYSSFPESDVDETCRSCSLIEALRTDWKFLSWLQEYWGSVGKHSSPRQTGLTIRMPHPKRPCKSARLNVNISAAPCLGDCVDNGSCTHQEVSTIRVKVIKVREVRRPKQSNLPVDSPSSSGNSTPRSKRMMDLERGTPSTPRSKHDQSDMTVWFDVGQNGRMLNSRFPVSDAEGPCSSCPLFEALKNDLRFSPWLQETSSQLCTGHATLSGSSNHATLMVHLPSPRHANQTHPIMVAVRAERLNSDEICDSTVCYPENATILRVRFAPIAEDCPSNLLRDTGTGRC